MNIKIRLRRALDSLVIALCGMPAFDKLVRYLAHQRKRLLRRLTEKKLIDSGLYGDVVQQGPFAGLKYLPFGRYASCRFEKIIGAYEHEIHPWLRELAATRRYSVIVNIGAAEGLYTCGMGLLFPEARLISFETDMYGRDYCREMAVLNGMAGRVDSQAVCTAEKLNKIAVEGRVLMVMDVDGGELQLLDPQSVPWLRNADLLVETHECFKPGINQVLQERFNATHHIRFQRNAGLIYADYPPLQGLRFEEIYAMVSEDRPSLQDWMLMQPKED